MNSEKNDINEVKSEDDDFFSNQKDGRRALNNGKESVTVKWVNKFSMWLYRLFIVGFFGKILTSYSSLQKKFKEGFIYSVFKHNGRLHFWFSKIRYFVSHSIENSKVLSGINKKLTSLLSVNLSSYGLFFMIFGGLTAVGGILKGEMVSFAFDDGPRIITGIVLVLASFVFIVSSKSLASAIKDGVILNRLLIGFFGIPKEKFETEDIDGRKTVPFAMFFAVLFGVLSYFINPYHIIGVAFLILALILVLKYPEVGVTCTLFSIPFVGFFEDSDIIIFCVSLITVISYFIKIICGRRVMKFEIIGTFIFLFALLVASGGLFSAGKAQSAKDSLILFSLILEYVVVVNIIKSPRWLKRCMTAVISALLIVSVMGVLDFLINNVGPVAYVFEAFPTFKTHISNLFSKKEAVSAFMIMIFPILAIKIITEKRLMRRFGYVVCMAVSIFTAVYLGSRTAWLGLFVGLVVFMIFYSYKTLSTLILSLLPFVCVLLFIPANIKSTIFDFFKISDVAISNRLEIWEGAFRMISKYFLSGIGIGESVLAETYPVYANSGFESVTNLESVYIEVLASLGITGLVIFAVIIFFFVQKMLGFMRYNTDKTARLPVLACLCSIISVLTMGLAHDIFSDNVIFLAFWMIIGLGCACVKVGDEIKASAEAVEDPTEQKADLIIDINI